MRSTAQFLWLPAAIAASLAFVSGCASTAPSDPPTESERREMLSLVLPQDIEVTSFSKIASFDQNDDVPDGILAVIRPLDRFGDPVKAVGFFYFDLWTYRNASQERKGERLAHWERTIASPEEIRLYWTRAQMFEFQLAWTQGFEAIKPDRKYILSAAYRTPWDETITDDYVLEFTLPAAVTAAGQ